MAGVVGLSVCRHAYDLSLPSLRAPARPRMTVTGLEGFVQNWCSGGKKASLLFSSCVRRQEGIN